MAHCDRLGSVKRDITIYRNLDWRPTWLISVSRFHDLDYKLDDLNSFDSAGELHQPVLIRILYAQPRDSSLALIGIPLLKKLNSTVFMSLTFERASTEQKSVEISQARAPATTTGKEHRKSPSAGVWPKFRTQATWNNCALR